MARNHGRVYAAIWTDPDWRDLPPDAQRLYMLLVSQQTVNWAGVLPLMVSKWAKGSAHTTEDDIWDALRTLQDRNYVVTDEFTEELLVRSFMRHNEVAKHPNTRKAAMKAARGVESGPLRIVLADELRRIGYDECRAVADEIAPVSHPEPVANPSGTRRDASIEREVEVAKEPTSRNVGGDKRSPRSQAKRGTRIPDDFTVTPEMVAWSQQRCPQVDGRTETEKFVNYWRAKSGRDAAKLDWVATWRNWMLTAAERAPSRASPQQELHRLDRDVMELLTPDQPLRALPGGAQ